MWNSKVLSALIITAAVSMSAQADDAVVTSTSTGTPQDSTVTTTTVQPNGDTKVVETRHTVVTSVPTANTVITAPGGFISCTDVAAGWFNNFWVPQHKVCKYENSPQGSAWISGYWKCDKATDSGVCLMWEWQEGRWEKTYMTY